MKKILCLLICLSFWLSAFNQKLYYADVFYGGVTGAGFGLDAGSNGASVIAVNIPSTSTVRKAFLISGRHGNAPALTINFAGNILTFDSTNQTDVNFQSLFGGNSSVHIIDVTSFINPAINSYTINVSTMQQGGFNRYNEFYLYVLYDDTSLPVVNAYLFLNNQDFGFINYSISNIAPINNTNDVGLSLLCGYICGIDSIWNYDGEFVYVNGLSVGLIGGNDVNSGSCGGPYGDFYYENNQLFGLSDDTGDTQMSGSDVVLDMKPFLLFNDTSFILDFISQSTQFPNNNSNAVWSFFLTYSNNCDTFTTTATTNIDTICAGENIQLNATGGAMYSWFSAFSTFNDSTLANPVAMPSQTTTYIVTIKNDSGCVKTEQVKVWVHPTPKPDTIITTPQRCSSADGSITVGNIPNGTASFTYQLTNLQSTTTTIQSTPIFNNLSTGLYLLSTSDSNGCQWQSDTLFVPEINDIIVNFSVYTLPWVFPEPNPLGTAPLTVYTQNSSVNASIYEWTISQQSSVDSSQDTIAQYSTLNTQHSFEEGGTFEICLLAYNNIPVCGDTVCKTIVIAPNSGVDSLVLIVPNVFSPNHDGSNDNFVLQVQSVSLLESLEVEIFNRWGQIVESRKWKVESLNGKIASSLAMTELVLWDGRTNTGKETPEGTYFYVINYTKLTGESESLKGVFTLLR